MSDTSEPRIVDEPAPLAARPSDRGTASADGTDEALLAALEDDLAAVESAMATLDRIAAEGPGGHEAAQQIAAVVSAERFPVDDGPVAQP